jgi:hypothetical protein
MNTGTGTHENEDSISIFLPALDHLVVLFLCGFGVYGEEWSRAVTEDGFSMRWLRWCWPSLGAIDFIYIYEPGGDRSKQQVTHTCVVPSLEVLMSHLRHQRTIEEILRCGPDETWQAPAFALGRNTCVRQPCNSLPFFVTSANTRRGWKEKSYGDNASRGLTHHGADSADSPSPLPRTD